MDNTIVVPGLQITRTEVQTAINDANTRFGSIYVNTVLLCRELTLQLNYSGRALSWANASNPSGKRSFHFVIGDLTRRSQTALRDAGGHAKERCGADTLGAAVRPLLVYKMDTVHSLIGGVGSKMLAGSDEIVYHLTERGWESGDEPPNRIEFWRRSVSVDRVSWRCIWVNLGIALRMKHRAFMV
jgi:hypothetical protein